jgi:hypothetical protein
MIQLEALPRFPCNAEKAPLVPHWKIALPVRKGFDRDWPLVGIPTGKRSGIDILDVDIEGAAWFNEMPLPATRHQFTRSGGIHLFFRHAEGLRCSVSRIADGIDVRADGGYVIDWHREGLPTAWPDLIVDWPEWLLERARNGCVGLKRTPPSRSVDASGSGSVDGACATKALWRLDPLDFRDHDRWLAMMMGAYAAGIERKAFVEWSTSDPQYAEE